MAIAAGVTGRVDQPGTGPASRRIHPNDHAHEADVYAVIDYLGEVGHTLHQADPARSEELYETLREAVGARCIPANNQG